MTLARKSISWVIAAGLMVGLASPAFALNPSTTSDAGTDRDGLRTGGCTGCFDAQMQAAIASFASINRVFRICQKGAALTGDNCDGSGNGVLAQFIELQGVLRNSSTDPLGLGVPGGSPNDPNQLVTYRISGNGSGNGLACASGSGPTGIGFIAPEGFDGIPNTADDAGGNGVNTFGQPGPGTNNGLPGATGDPNDTAPAMTACDTKLRKSDGAANGYAFTFPGSVAEPDTAYPARLTQEFCIINVDKAPGDKQILNDRVGAAAPGVITKLGQLNAANETTNLTMSCDTGFADLPPTDFIQASLNTLTFANQDTFGAQIFKIVASKDVHANGTNNKKVQLAKPQIEGIFNAWSGQTTCSWQQVGADSGTHHVAGPPLSGTDMNVCYRALGSGTREVFRNTWDANTKGDANQGQGSTVGITNTCAQRLGSITAPANTPFRKTLIENGGTNDVKTCVSTNLGAVGYVDGFINTDPANPLFYGVPVDGVDPDTNDLKLLTRCGLYRYWGPLAGGTGGRLGGIATDPKTGHRFAMKVAQIFVTNESYLPSNGLNYNKTATDGASVTQFVSPAFPAADACPGSINPPGTIPGVAP
ncbi:MAG TPA: hypothetical protein VMR86_01575 [Myxococcota bacterium]|nr:hypothetical protein [Myxococcota bacterium]